MARDATEDRVTGGSQTVTIMHLFQHFLSHDRCTWAPTRDAIFRSVGEVMDRPPQTDPRRDLGAAGERLAAAHLQRLGYAIVERNHRTRWGEIDLIAHERDTLVFVEVKTRRSGAGTGSPFDAVGARKQGQVRRMAAAWLARVIDRPHAEDLRFDVIGVTVDAAGRLQALEHREGVF
jgi:putative endonuclease